MPHVLGIDHVAFAATDLEETCAFYDRLFGARTHLDYAPEGESLVRQIAIGGGLLSVHQTHGLPLWRPSDDHGEVGARLTAAEHKIAGAAEHQAEILFGSADEPEATWQERVAARRREVGDGVQLILVRFVRPTPEAGHA